MSSLRSIETQGFDVIGDVHGYADKLVGLLETMGYRAHADSYRHSSRTAVFIGDLIDRKVKIGDSDQRDVVRIVRSMVESGAARIVMGNHEFNAISWSTVVDGSTEHRELVEWFGTIPLWIDDGDVRFIHACWHRSSMEVLEPVLGPGRTVTPEMMVSSSTKGHPHYDALETLLKGPEVDLPPGEEFVDNYGTVRSRKRVEWWADDAWYTDDTPVFFGHHWSKHDALKHGSRAMCVDLSAARKGPLGAYRWDGESVIDTGKLVMFPTP